MSRRQIPLRFRFWAKVEKMVGDCCWEWLGAKAGNGYGVIGVGKRGEGLIRAHRLSWELHYGKIPEGEGFHGVCVLHKCDNPGCVNPNHLYLGTQAENVADMVERGRCNNKKGAKASRAKLTDEQVREIRRLSYSMKQTEIAKKFGVSSSHISRIVRGELWDHILYF